MAATHSPLALAVLLAALLAHAALANKYASEFKGRVGKHLKTDKFILHKHEKIATRSWDYEKIGVNLVGVNVTITEENGFNDGSPSIEISDDLHKVILTRHGFLNGPAHVEITWQLNVPPYDVAAGVAGARAQLADGAALLPAIP